jgi:hypothetical protein
MNRYMWFFLWVGFFFGCSDIKQPPEEAFPLKNSENLKYSDVLSFYDSLLFKYGLKESNYQFSEFNTEMVIEHTSVGSFFVYNLSGNDSTMRVKFSIVKEKEVVLSFEKLFWEDEVLQINDSLQILLKASSFWELSNEKVDCDGADGTYYMLKVRKGGDENQVFRWSPLLCELPKGEEVLRIVDYLLSLTKMESYETKYF